MTPTLLSVGKGLLVLRQPQNDPHPPVGRQRSAAENPLQAEGWRMVLRVKKQ